MGKKIYVGDMKIGTEERAAINAVLDSGRITEWKKVREFENLFSRYVGKKHCILVNSGTSALIAGLHSLLLDERFPKVKRGAKVITSPLTYIATVNAIVHAGLEPVFADIKLSDFNMDCESAEKLLRNGNPDEYCIILPVHLMGYPCDMERIHQLADTYNLLVFEDAAQAHGTVYHGKKLGNYSILADFSFYVAHNIQAGEMGALVTDDSTLDRTIRKLKANGRMCDCGICTRMDGYCKHEGKEGEIDQDPRFLHDIIGFNFKTMEFCAALGVTQLGKAEEIIKTRQNNVARLNARLARYTDHFQLAHHSCDISYLAYPLLIQQGSRVKRKAIRAFLEENGVESRPLFGCIPTQQPAYDFLKEHYKGRLPNAEYAGENGFYIGCHQYMTEEDIEYIGALFDRFMEGENEFLEE